LSFKMGGMYYVLYRFTGIVTVQLTIECNAAAGRSSLLRDSASRAKNSSRATREGSFTGDICSRNSTPVVFLEGVVAAEIIYLSRNHLNSLDQSKTVKIAIGSFISGLDKGSHCGRHIQVKDITSTQRAGWNLDVR
jgi:hypothetical protein